MTIDESEKVDKNWVDTSASFAPAALGAAAGLIVGDMMHRDARRGLGFALAALGLAALAPTAVGVVVDKVNGPKTSRGSQRTLQSIRDAGVSSDDFADVI